MNWRDAAIISATGRAVRMDRAGNTWIRGRDGDVVAVTPDGRRTEPISDDLDGYDDWQPEQ